MPTCREEILAAARVLGEVRPDNTFTPAEIVSYMKRQGTAHQATTIRTHVCSVMCADALIDDAETYDDLEQVAHGRYRLC